MSPVKLFQALYLPHTGLTPNFQNSDFRTKPLKWSEARRMALRRDKTCRICDSDTLLTVHHMWPRGLDGGHEIENLVTLCESCHQHLCTTCSRSEEARVPGWAKPDLSRQHGKQLDPMLNFLGTCSNNEDLSGIFSESPISLANQVPRKLLYFWELTDQLQMGQGRRGDF